MADTRYISATLPRVVAEDLEHESERLGISLSRLVAAACEWYAGNGGHQAYTRWKFKKLKESKK